MVHSARRRELARADRVRDGLWRLRLPLPWPAIPHVNAFAVRAGDGVVLIDCGLSEPGALGQLERALDQAGYGLEDVSLLVCTHAHIDHYGLAGPVVDGAACELWMHHAHEHATRAQTDPEQRMDRRIEVAMQSGVPAAALERYRDQHSDDDSGIARVVVPGRDLVDGVEVETDLGTWRAYETPGHAPSHVVLHQAERGLLLSGDHLLGRVSQYFDYGFTPDPLGEFLTSLDRVAELDVGLVLAGHGRPVRDAAGLIDANRRLVERGLEHIQRELTAGQRTAFELAPGLLGLESLDGGAAQVGWALSLALSHITHLERDGRIVRVAGAGGEPDRWRLGRAPA